MKTRIFLSFVTISLFIAVFFSPNLVDKKIDLNPLAGMNIVKCSSTNFLLNDIDSTKQIAPLFENLGDHVFSISTKNKESQIFFNQGLNLAFAFNHPESHRSFLEASRLDPNAAMTYWGQAYVLGPNINDRFPDAERRLKCYEAVQKAVQKATGSSSKELDLINALSHRYSKDSVDVSILNMAYMKAMEKVVKKYPEDPDILTLYAAAVMNTVPWKYWDKDGNPSPNIKEAKLALETALEINSKHPGANHYYIHMVELPKPDLAVSCADRLGGLMPGAGHIVHMPGHIYMRVGRYKDAVLANQKAILVDEDYISQCYAQGIYPLGYYPHNIHFLWSASSMLGSSEIAIDAAKKTAEKVPLSELKSSSFLQNFASTPLLSYTRFGKWNEVLTVPDPGDEYVYMKLIWHYTRGIAFVRKNNLKEAQEELDFIAARDKDLDQERVAKVAYEVLAGEIAAGVSNLPKAIEHLKKAVKYEDELPYDEPSVWYIPTRQSLGAVLLKAKRFQDAEKIYLEDLSYYRSNGWSLMGLYQSLIGQGKKDEANKIKNKFEIAWSDADIEISSSVL